jgi:hypothetical protein
MEKAYWRYGEGLLARSDFVAYAEVCNTFKGKLYNCV